MEKTGKSITITGVDHENGSLVLVELSDGRTIYLAVEDILRLAEAQPVRLDSKRS